jgi:hypothetical protein
MERAPLDPRLRGHYYLFLGAGQQRFGKDAEAEASFAEGLAVAETNQLHQIAHEATVALENLKKHEAPRRERVMPVAEIPLSLRQIASELSTLREAAMSSP